MIMHTCIKCDYFEMIHLAEQCPSFEKYTCPGCGTVQWIKHSRFDPETYPEDMVEVDEEKGILRIKGEDGEYKRR